MILYSTTFTPFQVIILSVTGKTYSIVSYFFALFSKEMANTLPLILFFYYWLFYRKQTFSIPILRHYIGYCFVAIFYFIIRFWWFHNSAESFVTYPDNSVWLNFMVMSKVFASYIMLFFLPTNLNADYIVPISKDFTIYPLVFP
ncbi:MAG: hypothetical protein E3K37_16090 [Candidatus Kuenenia sp.]|nr:hypothetical protein [Candidatus Kuenenia hertensis]